MIFSLLCVLTLQIPLPPNFSPCAEDRKITLKDLIEAAQDEVGKATTRMGFRRQDSDAARMFN